MRKADRGPRRGSPRAGSTPMSGSRQRWRRAGDGVTGAPRRRRRRERTDLVHLSPRKPGQPAVADRDKAPMRSTLVSRNASCLVAWVIVILVGFGCAHVHAPQLHVDLTAGRATGERGGRAWHQAGWARMSWPLGPRARAVVTRSSRGEGGPLTGAPETTALTGAETRPRVDPRGGPSALPGTPACVEASLCAWERRARARAWASRMVRRRGERR